METSLRALIVEDSEDDAVLLVRELSKGGYDPVFERVYTADAMRSALQRQQWDVVICDYVVPGFGASAALKLFQDTGLDVPFIVVSGKVGEEAAIETMKAGAHDYVLKNNLARLCPAIGRELLEAGERRARREAQDALRESGERYRLLADSAADAIISCDDSGKIVSLNKAALNMFGRAEAEMLGRPEAALMPERYRQAHQEALVRMSTTGASHIVGKTVDFHGLRKDGSEFPLALSLSTWQMGDRRYYTAIMRDMTERNQAEEALRESHKQTVTILESITNAFIAFDREWRFTYVNAEAERLLRRTRSELVGKNLWLEFPEAVVAKFYDEYHRAVSEQVTVAFEEFYGPLDTWLEVRAYPSAEGLSVFFQDINERKNMELDRENARKALEDVYNRERRIAETLQRNFLPDKALTLEGYELVDVYEPALDEAAIGGDVYDTFELPGGKVGLAIADVSGKGLRAARYGAMVKYMLRAYAYRTEDPGAVMSMLNASVTVDLDLEAFVTCFFGVLDPAARILTYANAGHDEPICVSRESGAGVRLDVTGNALGLLQDSGYDVRTVALRPGDTLFLYTDGVTDARGVEPRLGADGLEHFISTNCAFSAKALVECVLAEVKRRSGDHLADDVAIVALEVL